MKISFVKEHGQRYHSLVYRPDGVCVELVAGGYNQVGGPAARVPHDLAHFIVEEELHLEFGLWGLLAAGVILHPKNTHVVAGRQPPHVARKSQEILKRAGEKPAQAEVVVRAVADLALAGKHDDVAAFNAALGKRYALPGITPSQLAAACQRLQEGGTRWASLEPGQTSDVYWNLRQSRK